MSDSSKQKDWWLGVADMASVGLTESARSAERVHIAIADETFNVLREIPVTSPVSEPVRSIHHGIAKFCYRSVAQAGESLSKAIKHHSG